MTRRRYELTDHEWSIIEPLLPNKPRGVPRSDDRQVLNGILWRFRTGSPWAEIPERAQRLIANLRIPHEGSAADQFVTVSMGVGTIKPSEDGEPKHFLDAVDRALYGAKRNGRNRIETVIL